MTTTLSRSASEALGAVPWRVQDPAQIPAQRYYEDDFYRLECERVWPHVWQMACRLEEIPEIGDWVEYSNVGQSVIVVRTAQGVRAYHNACRHRGVQLATGQGNCRSAGFICPFHGWRWDLEGENTFVFGREFFDKRALAPSDLALRPCRVETWGGCAFINHDDEAPSLRECMGPVTERLDARNISELKIEWWRSTVLPVNWKLAMEAFMESFHLMRTHPQLHALSVKGAKLSGAVTPEREAPGFSSADYVDLTIRHLAKLSEGMGGMVHASEVAIAQSLREISLPNDPAGAAKEFYRQLRREITVRGRERGLPVPDLAAIAASHPVKAVEYMFPHYFLLPVFSAMSAYRVRPLGADSCLFEIYSLAFSPDEEPHARPKAPMPLDPDDPAFPEVPRQDYANLLLQQQGLRSRGFEYMRLASGIEGLISNYQRLIDGYIADMEPCRLAHASRVVCQGLDEPIHDIGF